MTEKLLIQTHELKKTTKGAIEYEFEGKSLYAAILDGGNKLSRRRDLPRTL